MGFNEQLEAYQKAIANLVPTPSQKAEITNKGADVLEKSYYDATKSKHYDDHREIGKVKHLADAVMSQNSDIDGDKTGTSTVGYMVDPINHARIARFLNDGTRYIKGDHFIDKAIEDSKEDILQAQFKEYKKLTGGN